MTHNGGPPIDADGAPKLRVVRIHINDWVASTRGMSLDEEGFFWRFTCLFYDRMGNLPDDDGIIARALNLDIRRYRHMKNLMVKLGKISVEDGRLTNARAEREINSYLHEYKRRSEAAKQRENAKRVASSNYEIAPTSVPTSTRLQPDFDTDVAPMSDELRTELAPDLFKKDNKNNVCGATTVAEGDQSPHVRARPKPKPKPLSEVSTPHTPPQGGHDPLDQAFEDFWKAFPAGRKQAKGEARDAFRRIVTGKHRRGLRAKAETLIASAARYAASHPDPEFVPMPSTWLNGGRWEDDPQPSLAPDEPWWMDTEKVRQITDDQWRGSIAKYANGIWPPDRLGPAPGNPRCVVPKHLITELRLTERYTEKGISREKH